MSGHWPPEWEDREEEFPEGADQLDAEAEAQLSEVAAYLASVPVPVMPDSVETRISAALAAEATTRAGHAAAPADASRTLDRKKARARLRRNWGGGGPRRFRPGLVGGSLVVCLLVVGLGFALSLSSSSSSSSSEASAAGGSTSSSISAESNAGSSSSAKSAVAPKPAGSFAPAAGHVSGAATPVPTKPARTPAASATSGSVPATSSAASLPAPAPSSPKPSAAPSVSFAITASGTKYHEATLASQVQASLNAPGGSGASPSTALRGCVSQVTGGQSPRLVDQATYQGSPAYIIATSSRAWVVGLGCTAAKTELITSVPLAGLPGNLRALVSVEHYRRTSSI